MYKNNIILRKMMCIVKHYNPNSYWKMREYVISRHGFKLLKYIYLFRIKRMDSYNCASFGTHIGYGAEFANKPILPHGLNGIIVSHNAKIGKNATIFHQVTIGEGNKGAPVIGDNVFIGAGAKIIGSVKIGDNVRVGSGCIVAKDVPDNSTVVLGDIKIIEKGV